MIPVITYHSVSPSSKISVRDFEEHLKYLVHSGFSFHFASEVKGLTKRRKSKQIAITIDDGYYDAFRFIFPLIKKYDVKLTVFLITSRIGSSESSLLSPAQAHSRFIDEGDKRGFLCCRNILEMQSSGLVEFQSHSRYHLLHYARNSIHSFYNPPFNHHWSLRHASNATLKRGMPLYTLYPSLVSKRYFPSSKLSEAMHNEAEKILQQDNNIPWKDVEKILHKKALKLSQDNSFDDEHYEEDEERLIRIRDDLMKSRLCIEEILSRKVSALSWPWGIYTNNLAKLAEDAGYDKTFSLQRRQQEKTDAAFPRLVINKGSVDNLEKKLLVHQSGLLKKVTYSLASPEKSFWSPQKR